MDRADWKSLKVYTFRFWPDLAKNRQISHHESDWILHSIMIINSLSLSWHCALYAQGCQTSLVLVRERWLRILRTTRATSSEELIAAFGSQRSKSTKSWSNVDLQRVSECRETKLMSLSYSGTEHGLDIFQRMTGMLFNLLQRTMKSERIFSNLSFYQLYYIGKSYNLHKAKPYIENIY